MKSIIIKKIKCIEVDGIHPATKVTGILPSFFVNSGTKSGKQPEMILTPGLFPFY